MVLAVEGATSGLTDNLWWAVVALVNVAIGIGLVAAVVLLVRWLLVSRPRRARELAELTERVARLEAAQMADPGPGGGPGTQSPAPRSTP
jgi:hypothetical protein